MQSESACITEENLFIDTKVHIICQLKHQISKLKDLTHSKSMKESVTISPKNLPKPKIQKPNRKLTIQNSRDKFIRDELS